MPTQLIQITGISGFLRGFWFACAMLELLMVHACTIAVPISSPASDAPGRPETEPERRQSLSLPGLDPEDWRRARGALAVAIDPSGNGLRVPWDNPETHRRGTVAPTGLPVVRDGVICRPFSATVESGGQTSVFRGTACRDMGDGWDIIALVP